MTKSQLISAVADSSGVKRADVTRVVETLFGSKTSTGLIAKSLKKGDKIGLAGFGTFKVSHRAAREGVNPATGKKIKIAARKVPRFTASRNLKDAI